jgi:hypothetical protein
MSEIGGIRCILKPVNRVELWPAAGSEDTHLSESSLPFKLNRAQIPMRWLPPLGIIEALNVIEHIGLGPAEGTV